MTQTTTPAAEAYRHSLITALARYGHDVSALADPTRSPLAMARKQGIPEEHLSGAMQAINYYVAVNPDKPSSDTHPGLLVGYLEGRAVWASYDPFEPGIEDYSGGLVAYLHRSVPVPPPEITPPTRAAQAATPKEPMTVMDALFLLGHGNIQTEELHEPNYHKVLLRHGRITTLHLAKAFERLTGIPFIDPKRQPPQPDVRNLLSQAIITSHRIVPHSRTADNKLIVLTPDPTDEFGLVCAQAELNTMEVVPAVADEADIEHLILTIYRRAEQDAQLEKEAAGRKSEEDVLYERNADPNDPVARRILSALEEAASGDASDVHFQPSPDGLQVRERLHGNLLTRSIIPLQLASQAINQLKIMAGMSLDARVPQDKRINMELDIQGTKQQLRLRASSLPSLRGDSIVLRLLKDVTTLPGLDNTAFTPHNLALLRDAISASSGMILVTGPTGSGKTTLMHTVLKELNDTTVKIMTIEDPIEYEQPNFVQTPVRITEDTDASLTFAKVLRSILRQDPDIIFVGEIRDEETANVAVNAAQTGHLLLSTLHTNSALATITRLLDLKVPPYLIAESLRLVVSQRLVNCPCPECSEVEPIPDPYGRPGETMLRGTGKTKDGHTCALCSGTGDYRVIPIHEVLSIDQDVRQAILDQDMSALNVAARASGLRTLLEDGLEKVRQHKANLNRVIEVAK